MSSDGPTQYEKFDDNPRDLYRTVKQIREEQATQGKTIDKISTALLGNFEHPNGMVHIQEQHCEKLAEHHKRIKSLEDSRDEFNPVVAAHKSRRRDWGTFKGGIIGTAAGAFGGWMWSKLTGKTP